MVQKFGRIMVLVQRRQRLMGFRITNFCHQVMFSIGPSFECLESLESCDAEQSSVRGMGLI